jgi:ribulose kinase
MKSKSAAVNRARQFALIIGTSSCAMDAHMASQIQVSHGLTRISVAASLCKASSTGWNLVLAGQSFSGGSEFIEAIPESPMRSGLRGV